VDAERISEEQRETGELLRRALLRWLDEGGASPDELDIAMLE
jgi:hypothetical protein